MESSNETEQLDSNLQPSQHVAAVVSNDESSSHLPADEPLEKETEEPKLTQTGKARMVTNAKKKKRVKITLPKERVHAEANKNNNNTAPLTKIKLVRRKRKPSRYQDCLFDVPTKLMNINRTIDAEVFRACQRRSPKSAKPKSTEKKTSDQQQSSPPNGQAAVFCAESAGNAVTFDEEGNFRFKVCKEHTSRSKMGVSYRCDICDMLFPRSFSLSRHYERLHINPRFIRNKGKKDQEIISELSTALGGQEGDQKTKQTLSEKCVEKIETKEREPFSDAENSTEPEGDSLGSDDNSFYLFACKLCSRQKIFFKKKDELRRHHQAKHGNLVRKMLNVFKCDSCERSYPTHHELLRHQRSHSGERPYACRFCAKRFPTSTNARRHERTHPCDRTHLCKVCNKSFIQKSDLVKHLRSVHKMKVTKTKAERAVRKKQKVTLKPQTVTPTIAPVHGPSKPNATPSKPKPDSDKSNQFEENIDFAAYLKLDQFEKGSLMGGQSVVEHPSTTDRTTKTTPDRQISSRNPRQDAQMPDPCVSVGADGKPKRSHKCTECPKSFTSQVNLRRHFRLKHERNQVVRAAMPVSMVVEKFKIQDEEEAKEEELKQQSMVTEEKRKMTGDCVVDVSGKKTDSTPITTPVIDKDTKEPSLPQREVSVVNTSSSSAKVEEVKDLLPRKKVGAKAQQGSKLSSILQRLSDRQDSVLKTSTTGAEPPSEGSLNSRVQRRTNKRKLPVPSQHHNSCPLPENIQSILQESDLLVPLNEELPAVQSNLKIGKATNSSPWGHLRHQVFNQSPKFHHRRQQKTFHVGRGEGPMSTQKLPPPQYSLPATIPQYFVSFSPATRHDAVNAGVTYTVAQPKRVRYNRSVQRKDLGSTHGVTAVHKPPRQYERPQTNVVPTNTVRGGRSATIHHMPQPPRPKPPRPRASARNEETHIDMNPLNLKVSNIQTLDKNPSNEDAPLDLRHPCKKPAQDYAVTDDGVLDFSRKTRDSLPGKKEPEPAPLALTKSSSSRSSNQEPLSDKHSAFFRPSRPHQESPQNANIPQSAPQSLALPLKFHDVKFHKGRQVDGAGTAGRPVTSRRVNRTQRPRPCQQTHKLPAQQQERFRQSRFHPYTLPSEMSPQSAKKIHGPPPPYFSHNTTDARRHSDEGFVPIINTPGRNVPPPPSGSSLEHKWHDGYPQGTPANVQRLIKASSSGRQSHPQMTHQQSAHIATARERPRISQDAEILASIPRRASLDNSKTAPGVATKLIPPKHRNSEPRATDLDRDVMNRCIQKAQFELQMQAAGGPGSFKGQLLSLPTGRNHSPVGRTFPYDNTGVAYPGRIEKLQFTAGPVNVSSLHNINDHQLLTRNEANPRHKSSDSISEGNEGTNTVLDATKHSLVVKQLASSRNELTMTPGFDTNGEDSSRDGEEGDQVASAKSSVTVISQPSSPSVDQNGSTKTTVAEICKGNRKSPRTINQEVEIKSLDQVEESTDVPIDDPSETCNKEEQANLLLKTAVIMKEDIKIVEDRTQTLATKCEVGDNMFSITQHLGNFATTTSDIKETNLSTEVGPGEDCSLKETNLFRLDSGSRNSSDEVETPWHSEDAPKSDHSDSPETSRKFVQKLKLRAVKSQNGAAATQWTLVGGNGQNGQSNLKETDSINHYSETTEPNTNNAKAIDVQNTPRHQPRASPRKRTRISNSVPPTTPPKLDLPKKKMTKPFPKTGKEEHGEIELKSNKPVPESEATKAESFEAKSLKPVSKRDQNEVNSGKEKLAKIVSNSAEDGTVPDKERTNKFTPATANLMETKEAKRNKNKPANDEEKKSSENQKEKTKSEGRKSGNITERDCETDRNKSDDSEEEEVSKFLLLVVVDREAAQLAVSVVQTEQQLRRALRHEKNLMLKSKRVENQDKSTTGNGAFPAAGIVKGAGEEVEWIGKNVDVKSEGGMLNDPEPLVKLARSSYSRRSSKTTKTIVEIVPVVKDHTYVKQEHSRADGRQGNGKEEESKQKRKTVGNIKRKATAPRTKERRNLRVRSLPVLPNKVVQTKQTKHFVPAGKETFVAQVPASNVMPLPTTSTTVMIKADFVLKVPGSPAIGQKAFPPRKIDLSKILPPVSVHTKRNVQMAPIAGNNKRRSIRKYSKDFLPK